MSLSEETREQIDAFRERASENIVRIQGRLRRGSFKFAKARGVAIKRGSGKDPRPLVVADIETRIVQRALLDILSDIDSLRPYFINPYSFGGIRKLSSNRDAGVPAAIRCVLDEVLTGREIAVYADIKGFFRHIPLDIPLAIIENACAADARFIAILRNACRVELANIDELKREGHAGLFPTAEIGVAQGNSLSPLLGNILLSEFDSELNRGTCRCIRYIDDYIILGPSRKEVKAAFNRSEVLLKRFGLSVEENKSTREPVAVSQGVDYLGISFHSGLVRPVKASRVRLLEKCDMIFKESLVKIRPGPKGSQDISRFGLVQTLRRVSGTVEGWAKHYKFCNDELTFSDLDAKITRLQGKYIAEFRKIYMAADEKDRPSLLGVFKLSDRPRDPVKWRRAAERLREVEGAVDVTDPLTHPVAS